MTSSRLDKKWEFDLDTGTRKYKTWVYSNTGLDIESRFTPCKVTNITQILKTEIETPSKLLQDQLEPIV
jgi:hypothetical protein